MSFHNLKQFQNIQRINKISKTNLNCQQNIHKQFFSSNSLNEKSNKKKKNPKRLNSLIKYTETQLFELIYTKSTEKNKIK